MHTSINTLAAGADSLVVAAVGVIIFVVSTIFQKMKEAEAKAKRQAGAGGMQMRTDTTAGGLSPAEVETARRRREELRSRIQRQAPTLEAQNPGTQPAPIGGTDQDKAREVYRQRAEELRRERDAVTQNQNVSTGDRIRAAATENARAASAAHDKAEAKAKLQAAADKQRAKAEEAERQKVAAAPRVAGAAEPQPQSLLDSRRKQPAKPAPTAKSARAFSLKQAMIWKEILDPPVSMRD